MFVCPFLCLHFQEIVLFNSSSYFSYIGLFDSLSLRFLNPHSIQNHVFFICKQSLTNECYPQVLWKNVFCLRQLAKEIHKQDIVSTSRHPKRIASKLTANDCKREECRLKGFIDGEHELETVFAGSGLQVTKTVSGSETILDRALIRLNPERESGDEQTPR